MQQLKVSIVLLGHFKYSVNWEYIKNWTSDLFVVSNAIQSVETIDDPEDDHWTYTKQQLNGIFSIDAKADLIIGIICYRIEDNYYMRRLDDQKAVISLYEMAEILKYADHSLEQFIMRNIYELVTMYVGNSGTLLPHCETWPHDAQRGCLFDMNGDKADIVLSMHQPKLCNNCEAKLSQRQIDQDFLPKLKRELKRVKQSRYFRIRNIIRKYPILTIGVGFVSAIILNIIGSSLF